MFLTRKKPEQKLAQYSDEEHQSLHDITCCWLWLRSHMETTFPGEVLAKHDELFMEGYLARFEDYSGSYFDGWPLFK